MSATGAIGTKLGRSSIAMPGVVRVVTGAELAGVVASWRGEHRLFPALKAPEQQALAVDVARFQGEAVVAVLAATRAEAEDAAEAVHVEWDELPAVADAPAALMGDAAASPTPSPATRATTSSTAAPAPTPWPAVSATTPITSTTAATW